jgi:hypothetical protein
MFHVLISFIHYFCNRLFMPSFPLKGGDLQSSSNNRDINPWSHKTNFLLHLLPGNRINPSIVYSIIAFFCASLSSSSNQLVVQKSPSSAEEVGSLKLTSSQTDDGNRSSKNE